MENFLLHICCGPCATPIIPDLNKKFNISGFYYNPNIYPEAELERRLISAKKVTDLNGIKLTIPESSLVIPSEFEGSFNNERKGFLRSSPQEVSRNDNNYESYIEYIGETKTKPERCLLCYRQRLNKTAEYARSKKFSYFSTTLLVSPFQYHKELKKVGEEIGKEFGVKFYYQDFRPLYRQSRELAKAMNLYLQKYCGCKFSRKRR